MTRMHRSGIPAVDVYYHPYAYADLAGAYEKENRRAA